jgi:hypothetical protein
MAECRRGHEFWGVRQIVAPAAKAISLLWLPASWYSEQVSTVPVLETMEQPVRWVTSMALVVELCPRGAASEAADRASGTDAQAAGK